MHLTKQMVEGYFDHHYKIDTNSITGIDMDAAMVLAENWAVVFPDLPLRLNGLQQLEPETAFGLSLFHGASTSYGGNSELELNGLTDLSEKTADALIWNVSVLNHPRITRLSLGGLTSITPAIASKLARSRSALSLQGLKKINPDVANELSVVQTLHLDGLSELTPEIASIFVRRSATPEHHSELSLKGLKGLSDKTLDVLEGFAILQESSQVLNLDGIEKLDLELAARLSRLRINRLGLNGLTSFPPECWHPLLQFNGHLELNGLKDLPSQTEVMAIKSKVETLYLNGMQTLEDTQAEFLADLETGELELNGLKQISDRAFCQLMGSKGRVSLYGLYEISHIQSLELLEKDPNQDYKIGVRNLNWKVCKTLRRKVWSINTRSLICLTPKVAKRLAKDPDGTYLESLTRLTPRVAMGLSHSNRKLDLCGIKKLTSTVARILATSQAELILGLESLNAEVASILATYRGHGLTLGKLKNLEPEIARAFESFPGTLKFEIQHLDAETAAILSNAQGDIQIQFRGRLEHLEKQGIQTLVNNQCVKPYLGAATVVQEINNSGSTIEFCDYLRISPEAAEELKNKNEDALVCFEMVNRISSKVAASIGKLNDGMINLFGMRTIPLPALEKLVGKGTKLRFLMDKLDRKTAEVIRMHQGSLEFWGLTQIPVDVARILCQTQAQLSFPDLRIVPDDLAVELSAHGNDLHFGELMEITLFGAKMIAGKPGNIFVKFPKRGESIPSEGAIWLACHCEEADSSWYFVSQLLDTPVQEVFARKLVESRSDELTLFHLQVLGPKCADILSTFKGPITFSTMRYLSPEVAGAFSIHKGALILDVINSITPEVAIELARHRHGEVSLNGLVDIDFECAQAFAKLPNTLRMDGLKEISDSVAEALAKHVKGGLSLNGLEVISDGAAEALSKKKGPWLRLGNLKRLSSKALGSLKKFKGNIKLPKFRDPD